MAGCQPSLKQSVRKEKKYVNIVAFCVSVVPVGQTVGNVVPDAICQYLANHISTKWKRLGMQLSIGINVLNSIDLENRLVWDKSIMMFKTWKEKFDDKATVEVLREALENIGRNDLSKEVRGMSIPSSVNATTFVTFYPAVVNAAHARLLHVCSLCSLY